MNPGQNYATLSNQCKNKGTQNLSEYRKLVVKKENQHKLSTVFLLS